ncbi:MAG: hypothetical protein ACOYXC_08485 [Candidatus Rifleibacteriota bacterium]
MISNKKLFNLLNLAIMLAIVSFSNVHASDRDMIKGHYSGWDLGEVFADLARRGGLNIVGDFGEKKVSFFELNEETYIEEAINLLANSNGFEMRKNDEIWLAVPAEKLERESTRAVIREFSFKNVADLEPVLGKALEDKVKVWFPPLINGVAISGDPQNLDEMKKLIETLDTPEWTLTAEYCLSDQAGEPIASCSFLALNNNPFRLIFEEPDGIGIEINSTLEANYDGRIAVDEKIKIKHKSDLIDSSVHSLQAEKTDSTQTFDLTGRKLKLSRRFSIKSFRGKILPANQFKQVEPETITVPTAESEPELGKGYTVISGPQSPLLDEPLIIKNQPMPAILQKLASEEKIQMICDDMVTGKVSAFCHGKRLDKQDLIKAFAAIHGFAIFNNADGYTVSTPQKVADLNLSKANVFLSPELKRIPASKIARLIEEWLAKASAAATVTPASGNRLSISANEPWLGAIKFLLAKWSSPLPEFKIEMQARVNTLSFSAIQQISAGSQLRKAWKEDETTVHAVFAEKASSFDEGLQLLSYSINAAAPGKGRWMLQACTSIADSSPFTLFKSEGSLSVILQSAGEIKQPEPENFSEDGSDAADFDDAFDSQF